MNKRGRPRRYLQIDTWEQFIRNDWRHMRWKVNGLLGMLGVVVVLMACVFGIVIAILSLLI